MNLERKFLNIYSAESQEQQLKRANTSISKQRF